ncbi:MAG: hypothetical protein HY657_17670 [Acidobacteria bacterium]|nr:hypothetical protein [Acidobacteriota bacterium]
MAPDALHRELGGPTGPPLRPWGGATRVAFRFAVVYLSLYAVATQILGGLFVFPGFSFPAFGTRWPMRDITLWWADAVRVTSPLVYTGNSGDTAFYWVARGLDGPSGARVRRRAWHVRGPRDVERPGAEPDRVSLSCRRPGLDGAEDGGRGESRERTHE